MLAQENEFAQFRILASGGYSHREKEYPHPYGTNGTVVGAGFEYGMSPYFFIGLHYRYNSYGFDQTAFEQLSAPMFSNAIGGATSVSTLTVDAKWFPESELGPCLLVGVGILALSVDGATAAWNLPPYNGARSAMWPDSRESDCALRFRGGYETRLSKAIDIVLETEYTLDPKARSFQSSSQIGTNMVLITNESAMLGLLTVELGVRFKL